MATTDVLFFCMPEPGHFQRLVPLIALCTQRGLTAHVFTHASFAAAVAAAGGRFVDLFAGRPIAGADASSIPVPCRFVTFAGHYAASVIAQAGALRPALVVHDTFAVIGPVVARGLHVPCVNVCAGHDVRPARFLEELGRDPRVEVAPACERAAARLRDEHGFPGASPFSYVAMLSTVLNIYCEPPEFLGAEGRRVFEPIAFFGSLADPPARSPHARDGRAASVYVSFGTVVWRYYTPQALAALHAIVAALAERPGLTLRIGLGRAEIPPHDLAALSRPGVTIEPYTDQAAVLERSDLFVTHQGLNSTHEAIAREVPMLSYPFFWDQPSLARKCQDLGLALPLGDTPRAPLSVDGVRDALDAARERRDDMVAALARAAAWERRVIEERPAVIERLVSLM